MHTLAVKGTIQTGKENELELSLEDEMPRRYMDGNPNDSDFLWVGDYEHFNLLICNYSHLQFF